MQNAYRRARIEDEIRACRIKRDRLDDILNNPDLYDILSAEEQERVRTERGIYDSAIRKLERIQ